MLPDTAVIQVLAAIPVPVTAAPTTTPVRLLKFFTVDKSIVVSAVGVTVPDVAVAFTATPEAFTRVKLSVPTVPT